jgi:3-hydroxymyristoyl/3-hydroxydecanoyl-(acyl carrier protein) dehydratase
MWYGPTIQNRSESPDLGADVHIDAASPWFRGHFPGRPVLPGIAQMGMVFDLIQQDFNQPVRLTAVSRVRFKQLILPDDRIRIEVTPKANKTGMYAFRILKENELISNGILTVEKSTEAFGEPEP